MSEEAKCIECFQPDMPFITYYIFPRTGNQAVKIYHDPTDLEVNLIHRDDAWQEIERFDTIMAGGNPDES